MCVVLSTGFVHVNASAPAHRASSNANMVFLFVRDIHSYRIVHRRDMRVNRALDVTYPPSDWLLIAGSCAIVDSISPTIGCCTTVPRRYIVGNVAISLSHCITEIGISVILIHYHTHHIFTSIPMLFGCVCCDWNALILNIYCDWYIGRFFGDRFV